MMTNPHNHLYCEQYAEVGGVCRGVRHRAGGKQPVKIDCHVLLIQMLLCHLPPPPQVKYTQGGLENLELSRKYFAQALRLNNRNMRALFGLYMVSGLLRLERTWERKERAARRKNKNSRSLFVTLWFVKVELGH